MIAWAIRNIGPLMMAAALVLAYTAGNLGGKSSANLTWQAKWDAHLAADATATAEAQAIERAKEEGMRRTIEEVATNAQTEIDRAKASAAAARADADSLHDAADAYAAQLADSQAGQRACTTAAGKAAAEHARVLARLFKLADDTAGHLAEAADVARARGLACERAYEAVRAGAGQ